jgi:hypothetical protein
MKIWLLVDFFFPLLKNFRNLTFSQQRDKMSGPLNESADKLDDTEKIHAN